MGKDTSIAWTTSTLNLSWGCTKVSPGCDHCYMFRNSPMFGKNPNNIIYFNMDSARRRLKTYGELVFVNSNTDTFHEKHEWARIDEWFQLFREFPDKQFQILTKRPGKMFQYFNVLGRDCPANVWLGVSVEDQWHVHRIATLRKINAKVRFVSFEPLLGPIRDVDLTGIRWVITGGESGPGARPAKPEWFMEIMSHAEEYGSAFFHKQNGGTESRDGAGGDLLYGEQYHNWPNWTK